MSSNVQTIRFARLKPKQPAPAPTKPKNRHAGILQDQLRRSQKAPWCPSFSVAFRIFLLIRVAGAMYSNIQDCDEVFNFWEPLHYLDRGYGFQTWETSPIYAIRSWAYVLLHLFPSKFTIFLAGPEKRPAFFAVRVLLAVMSSVSEAYVYRAAVDKINYRMGRYMLFMMLLSAGMWTASTAFLPSTFAMYANAIAFAHVMEPTSNTNLRRTLFATLAFATGAIVGWPFSIAVAIPFVLEELFMYGVDKVTSENRISWVFARWMRMLMCTAIAALVFVPVTALDTVFYGKLTIVPWNIIKYNVFPDEKHGPNLYGTEPASFYLHNLILNFNVILPLAFASIPALAITYVVNRKRLGERTIYVDQTSPYRLMVMRLAPVYLWTAIMTMQPHKEERFMFPIYPLICFNAAVTVYLMRGWLETAFVAMTQSPYRASRSALFSRFTLSILTTASILSFSRVMTQWKYYHAPLSVYHHLEANEIPRILNTTGLVYLPYATDKELSLDEQDEQPRIDPALIHKLGLHLCIGKEWYRFPGHYLVPDGVRVDWIKSEFDGMLPTHFKETPWQWGLPARVQGTRAIPAGLNDLNEEAPELYVDVASCDYLVDLDFPLHPVESVHEPRYVIDDLIWDRVACFPFLDARHSSTLTRILWMPGAHWQESNEYGDYCLLRNRENVKRIEEKVMQSQR
ncbi:glycosyltransferase family 22 protein [Laetiporus sulphureus 93-53]|uniref:Mannosyltransferase n=1 Tax=Laetiporus sulphureus 93-53 TaxID=1314785 RepID=A0A165F7D6_9APHY|nr:glycosyltransferase family 22 protein [Laetiporus sulphureus 93-53]KZT08529.1 glycosyltransferase family 22 protein [Laetiporus sulphureus 93-53]